jgi:hypothetical protein
MASGGMIYIHDKSNDDRFRHSSNIKGITSKIWDAIVLVLLMTGIYDLRQWGSLRWIDIYTYQVSWRLVQTVKQY